MEQSVAMYDEHDHRVGATYPRRAKQLVRSGRAVWLIEDSAIRFVAVAEEATEAGPEKKFVKEPHMNDNGIPAAIPHAPPEEFFSPYTPEEEFLMDLARKNVREKRALRLHIVAYILAWAVMMPMLFVGHFDQAGHHTRWVHNWHAEQAHRYLVAYLENHLTHSWYVLPNEMLRPANPPHLRIEPVNPRSDVNFSLQRYPFDLDYVRFVLPGLHQWHPVFSDPAEITAEAGYLVASRAALPELTEALRLLQIASQGQRYSYRRMDGWFFLVGLMAAWGVFLLAKIIRYLQARANTREKPRRHDPIFREYQRLKEAYE